MIRKILLAAILVLPVLQQSEPTVRIGLDQNAAALTIRSSEQFQIQGQTARTAKFSTVLTLGDTAEGATIRKDQVRYRMAVELDGGQHSAERDAARTEIIENYGYRVLRFWNNDVLQNTYGALEAIRHELLIARTRPE